MAQAESGVVPVIVASALMGGMHDASRVCSLLMKLDFGIVLFLIQIVVAVLSTGSAELAAVSSLITYGTTVCDAISHCLFPDIYQAHINPLADVAKLRRLSQWTTMIVGLLMGLTAIILDWSGISLSFMYLLMGIIIGSAVSRLLAVSSDLMLGRSSRFDLNMEENECQ